MTRLEVATKPSLVPSTMPPAWAGVALCALLAVAQVGLGGYQLGVGNQSIQIAFLKHWEQPWRYATDDMVRETLPAYPSYFFRLLALFVPLVGVPALYLMLQLLTSFATLSSVYLLSRSIFRSHGAALVAAVLLLNVYLPVLGGDALYFPGFTHTFAALPMAVGALALGYRKRWGLAFALAGLLVNLHALTAAYVLTMLGAGLFADFRERSRADWLSRAFLCGAVVVGLASPTLALMAQERQVYSADWIDLMRIRSADHSFPSTWWSGVNTDVPRFLLVGALFVLSWSFLPLPGAAGGLDAEVRRHRRITGLMTWSVLLLFGAGYVFTEVHPVPLVIRLQPFRASRLLMVLMLVHVAYGAIVAMRVGVLGASAVAAGEVAASRFVRVVELLSGTAVLGVLAVPALLPWLPWAVVLGLLAALMAGHVSWRQGVLVTGALLVTWLAYLQLRFPIPWLSTGVVLQTGGDLFAGLRALALGALITALLAAGAMVFTKRRTLQAVVGALAGTAALVMGWVFFSQELRQGGQGNFARMAQVSAWARTHTAPTAVFLTPTGLDNFRATAERAIVTSWRDGTQLYFSAAFGPEWLDRIASLEPGFQLTADGKRLLTRGDAASLASVDDNTLIQYANDFNADYILLPTVKGKSRTLVVAKAFDDYTVYEPRIDLTSIPTGVKNPVAWNRAEHFMATTVAENIEKYRRTDVTIEVTDVAGRPVRDAAIRLDQTKQAFVFGVSLGFFEPNTIPAQGDEKPAPARPIELEKAPEIFNGSMIPFSGKWQYIEWEKGKPTYKELDKYVDYCARHGLTVEYHHLAGTLPRWAADMGGVAGQSGLTFAAPKPGVQAEFDRHCLEVVGRYADRVEYFQVENEKYMMQYVPGIFKRLQETFPKNKFGISDCIRFWDGAPDSLAREAPVNINSTQFKGADVIDWLAKKNIKPDFFSVHGHHPDGLWADPEEVYRTLNYFEAKGLRVHISEMYLDLSEAVTGPLRQGIPWTPALQADYLCRYLTVAFSHPDVDMVNLWGLAPSDWGYSSGGLIDAAGKTRPAWDALKELFTQTWRTHTKGVLAPDGTYQARTYQGDFTVGVTLPSGKEVTATIEVPSQKPLATFHLRLNAKAGTLEIVSSSP